MKKAIILLSLTAFCIPLNAMAGSCPSGDKLSFTRTGNSTQGVIYVTGYNPSTIILPNSEAFIQVTLIENGTSCTYRYASAGNSFTLLTAQTPANPTNSYQVNNAFCKNSSGKLVTCHFVAKIQLRQKT